MYHTTDGRKFGFVEWAQRESQSRSLEEAECVAAWYAAAVDFFYND